MKSTSILVTTTALALAVTASSFAQTAGQAGNVSIAAASQDIRSSKLLGMIVYNAQGEAVGAIEEVLIKGGAEPSAVLSVGDFVGVGDKLIVVPMSHLKLERSKVTMPTATKEHLASMPVFLFPPAQSGG